MNRLSMGNFKKNLGTPQPTEPIKVNLEPVEPSVQEPIGNEPTEPAVAEPVEPVINTEPTEPIEPVVPVQDNTPDDSGEPTPVQPNVGPSVIEPEPLELTDESVISYLSEKLGKQVTLDDLTKETVNPLDSDPYLKEIYEWRNKTGRPVEDFFKFQKDYSQVSDIDIVRENLQLEYPNATAEEINLELSKLTPSETDLEDDIARKNWELKKQATKGRAELEKLKSNLGEPTTTHLPEDIQNKVKYAEDIQKQVLENEQVQQEYNQAIEKTALETSSIKLSLGDLDIDFNISEDKRAKLPQDISDMSHWRNEDGSMNHKAVVEDGVKIKYFNDIINVVLQQGISIGKEEVIKERDNVTLGNTPATPQPNQTSKIKVHEPAGSRKRKLTLKSYKQR